MQRMAAQPHHIGLELTCHDPLCGRQVWRDFADYPPELTLRELRARSVCDWCGSLDRRGVLVSVCHSVFSTWPPTAQALEAHRTSRDRHKAFLDAHPFARRRLDGLYGYHPPDAGLMAEAHHRLGVPMCNLYANGMAQDAMRQIFNVKHDRLGNQPPLPAIFPDGEAPIIRQDENGDRELVRARWGWNRAKFGWVTNARHFDKWPWPNVIGHTHLRCLVPATAFAEYHPTERNEKGHKKVAWFRLVGDEDRPPFAFAGFVRRWNWEKDGLRRKSDAPLAEANTPTLAMTFCTTDANAVVLPIHPTAMPVILRPEDHETWLTGSAEDIVALQRPLSDDALEIAFIGGKEDAA